MLYSGFTVSPLFALLAITVIIGGTDAKPPSRIYGGETANGNKFTAVIGLAKPGELQHWCGGVIIGPRHILTAAHCVAHRKPNSIGVHAGIYDILDTGNVVERLVEKIIVRDDYLYIKNERTPENDIAILVLKEALPIGGRITILKLPTVHPRVGESYTIAGWGINSPNPTPETFQYELKTLTMSVVDADLSSFKMLYFHSDNGGICSGDSGSPFMKDGYVYGILSSSDCFLGGQANAVNIYSYIDWIKTNIRNNS